MLPVKGDSVVTSPAGMWLEVPSATLFAARACWRGRRPARIRCAMSFADSGVLQGTGSALFAHRQGPPRQSESHLRKVSSVICLRAPMRCLVLTSRMSLAALSSMVALPLVCFASAMCCLGLRQGTSGSVYWKRTGEESLRALDPSKRYLRDLQRKALFAADFALTCG